MNGEQPQPQPGDAGERDGGDHSAACDVPAAPLSRVRCVARGVVWIDGVPVEAPIWPGIIDWWAVGGNVL